MDMPTGGGTGGSRSIPTGAPSLGMASKKLSKTGTPEELSSLPKNSEG